MRYCAGTGEGITRLNSSWSMVNAVTDRSDDGDDIVGHIHADEDAGNENECRTHRTRPPKSLAHFPLTEITRFLMLKFRTAIAVFHANIKKKCVISSAETFTKTRVDECGVRPVLISSFAG